MLKNIKTAIILILMATVAYLLFQGSTFLDGKLENKPTPWVNDSPVTVAPVAPSTPNLVEPEATPNVAYMRGAVIQLDKYPPVADSKYPPLVVDDSPEASNSAYSWLRNIAKGDGCYPAIRDHIDEAFKNDGIIRKTENEEIISRCVDWNEAQDAGEKSLLREMVK